MLIDTHCHISIEDYDDIDKLIKDNSSIVDYMIVSGCSINTIEESVKIAEKYENVYATIGFHPDQTNLVKKSDFELLEKLISSQKVIGIGEIGLDYHYVKDNKKEQIELFEKQIKLAIKNNLPIVIHTRDATKDTIDILKKYNHRGVIHAFSGSYETAVEFIKIGYLLGIGGVLTFKNSNLYQVVERIGVDSLVLETDAPYLTPHPFRGKKNSSKFIVYTMKKLALVCNLSEDLVKDITSSNAIRMFDLKIK